MSQFEEMMGVSFPALAQMIFHHAFRNCPAPERGHLLQDTTVTVYRFCGSLQGEIAIFYPAEDRAYLTRLLLDQTLGTDAAAVDGGEDGVCLEITNILLGHMAGRLGEMGESVDICDPGMALPALDFAAEHPAFTDGAGTMFSIQPEEGGAGCLHAWLDLGAVTHDVPPHAAGPKVLIVDDSPVMCAFLQKIFSENGYEVVGVASDGLEAIEKFEETQPDLVTLDIIMPKMKGTEVLERILAKKPDAKVVMASSVSDARTVMKCLKVGAKRYIIKPYDQNAVLDAVQKVMGLPGTHKG